MDSDPEEEAFVT